MVHIGPARLSTVLLSSAQIAGLRCPSQLVSARLRISFGSARFGSARLSSAPLSKACISRVWLSSARLISSRLSSHWLESVRLSLALRVGGMILGVLQRMCKKIVDPPRQNLSELSLIADRLAGSPLASKIAYWLHSWHALPVCLQAECTICMRLWLLNLGS